MTSALKYKALIFAAQPPPVGGIASITAMLHQGLSNRQDIGFASPLVKVGGIRNSITRPFQNLFRLLRAIFRVKVGGRILIFSSEGGSFYEKIIWSILILLFKRKPNVFMVSGLFPMFWDKLPRIAKFFFVFTVHRKNFELIAQSETWRSYFQLIFPSANIKIAGATASEDFFLHKCNRPKPTKLIKILFVGWIIKDKGVFDLLDGISILVKSNSDIKLRMVGPLFDKEEFWKNALVERGISNQVEFVGGIYDRNILLKEFDDASIFVFPSHYEGFPVALLEAITLGLACVGTSVGGIPDILNHGEVGIIVEPKSPQSLASALKRLVDDKDLITTMSEKAYKRAREVYSHSKFIESFETILELK